jgi:hypothetical protein
MFLPVLAGGCRSPLLSQKSDVLQLALACWDPAAAKTLVRRCQGSLLNRDEPDQLRLLPSAFRCMVAVRRLSRAYTIPATPKDKTPVYPDQSAICSLVYDVRGGFYPQETPHGRDNWGTGDSAVGGIT